MQLPGEGGTRTVCWPVLIGGHPNQPYSGHASRTSLEIYSRLAFPRADVLVCGWWQQPPRRP
jgi:hypothetical protein